MNFKIVDEHNRQLEMGRNLASLRVELGASARESFQKLVQEKQAGADSVNKLVSSGLVANQSVPGKQSAQAVKPVSTQSSNQGAIQSENITAWTFGELPELLEIAQGKQTLIGYPALVDKGSSCQIQVFDDPDVATKTHRTGLMRLFALQLKEQLKFLEKNIPNLQQMGMQFMSLGSQEELRSQIIELAFDRTFLQQPLPKNADEFNQRKEQGRPRLNLLANEIARLVGIILAEHFSLPKKLQGSKSPATSDMQAQLQALLTKRFILETPYTQLTHFPRYLKAISVRLEKMRGDPARDAKLMQEWNEAASGWQRTTAQAKASDPKLQEYRWMLEELRVSLFAQELKTPMPVSAKRLQKVWDSMQR